MHTVCGSQGTAANAQQKVRGNKCTISLAPGQLRARGVVRGAKCAGARLVVEWRGWRETWPSPLCLGKKVA